MELQQGGNAPVGTGALDILIDLSMPAGVTTEVSAYLLGEDGRVRTDDDMIFFNQPVGVDGAVRLVDQSSTGGRFEVDSIRLPASLAKLVFCVTIEEAQARQQTLAMLTEARITVQNDGKTVANFVPILAGASEAAMIFGELYRRGGEWKFRSVGQGFDGGLAPLARSFGIEVEQEGTPAPPAPSPAPSINLSKISLDKPRQSVNLGKAGTSLGAIVVNLNWSRAQVAIDLDLGCLWQLMDGSFFVTQAIGNHYGCYDSSPWHSLDGDDRTGDAKQGETLRINGAQWHQIKRILIFADIYSGAPNWSATDGVVTVTMPEQPTIEVRMTEGRNDMRLCGIVLLENDGGTMKATRIVDYFTGRETLDEAFGWGMSWIPMGKD